MFRSRGPLKNYADKILTIFDYLPTSMWTFFTLKVNKKKHFLTTNPPNLVYIVFERPPVQCITTALGNLFCGTDVMRLPRDLGLDFLFFPSGSHSLDLKSSLFCRGLPKVDFLN